MNGFLNFTGWPNLPSAVYSFFSWSLPYPPCLLQNNCGFLTCSCNYADQAIRRRYVGKPGNFDIQNMLFSLLHTVNYYKLYVTKLSLKKMWQRALTAMSSLFFHFEVISFTFSHFIIIPLCSFLKGICSNFSSQYDILFSWPIS